MSDEICKHTNGSSSCMTAIKVKLFKFTLFGGRPNNYRPHTSFWLVLNKQVKTKRRHNKVINTDLGSVLQLF